MKFHTIIIAVLLAAAAPCARVVAQDRIRDVTVEALQPQVRSGIDSVPRAGVALPPEPEARREYRIAVERAKWILLVWFVLVLFYIGWAIHRYVYNYGLSNREWKVLYPAVYENSLDRLLVRVFKSKSYEQRRDELDSYRRRQRASASEDLVALPASSIAKLLDEPERNPYQGDSFGLPPGTIRGIIALTAIVLFGLIEYVNLYSGAMEHQFAGVVLALQMILAFYFGSRAVEVFRAKAAEDRRQTDEARSRQRPAEADEGARTLRRAAPRVAPRVAAEEPSKTALPEHKAIARFANIVATARTNGAGRSNAASEVLPAAAIKLTGDTPLPRRVLALTAAFETGSRGIDGFGALSGDFDGQGISFGALQWNIGQRSLQPLWKEMLVNHPDRLRDILREQYDAFSRMLAARQDEQMGWARRIQHIASGRTNAWTIIEPWKSRLQALGKSDEMIEIQVSAANALYLSALAFCEDYGLTTERGAALMFDIAVQNGSVDRGGAGSMIRDDFELINPTLSAEEQEVERMKIIARRRAQVARREWRGDVLARKMTIADGAGIVHGRRYDLEDDFAITLSSLSALV